MKRRHRRKRIKRGLRRPFEWLGILLGIGVFSFLTHRAMLRLCDFLAAVMYRFDRAGRALSLANLRAVTGRGRQDALPDGGYDRKSPAAGRYDPTRREELVLKGSYRNMARTVGHVFWTSRRARERAAAVVSSTAEVDGVLAANSPLVTVSGHLGCWEVLSQLVFLRGHRMTSVAKDIGTPAMTELLMRSRKSIGQEIVHADGAFRHLMQALRDGGDVGLLVDQVVRPEDGGLWVRFFGRPVPVSVAPAFLSAKARTPVAVAWSRPLKDGTYRCELIRLYPWRRGADIWERTQSCIRDLERVIRRHPSCWVLNYRYFRKVPKPEELLQLKRREDALRDAAD